MSMETDLTAVFTRALWSLVSAMKNRYEYRLLLVPWRPSAFHLFKTKYIETLCSDFSQVFSKKLNYGLTIYAIPNFRWIISKEQFNFRSFLKRKGNIFESRPYIKLGNVNVFAAIDRWSFNRLARCDIFGENFLRRVLVIKEFSFSGFLKSLLVLLSIGGAVNRAHNCCGGCFTFTRVFRVSKLALIVVKQC